MKIDRLFIVGCIVMLFLSIFFYYKVCEEYQLIDDFIHESIDNKFVNNRQYVATSLSTAIYYQTKKMITDEELDWYDKLETTYLFPASWLNLSAGVILKYRGYTIAERYAGPCGTMSRLLLNALWRLDIPARPLYLLNNDQGKGGGHVMVEFYDGGRWLVVSPADTAHIWRNTRGEIATAEEIKQDRETFKQIYKIRPDYDYLFDNYKHISFENLPPVIPEMIKITLGSELFDRLETPKLYDQPKRAFFYSSVALCLLFGILAVIAKNKRR